MTVVTGTAQAVPSLQSNAATVMQGTNQRSGLSNHELIMLWFCISCSLENINVTSLVANIKSHPSMALVISTLLT